MNIKSPKPLNLMGVLLLSLSSAAFGETVLQETYSDSLRQWYKHGACYDYSVAIVQDPCSDNHSNQVVRFINRMGEDNRVCDGWAGDLVTFPNGSTGYNHRAELVPKPLTTRVNYEKSHWVGQRIFIDKNWPQTQPTALMTISQIIPIFDGMSGTDMKFYINREQRWVFQVRVSKNSKKQFDLGPIQRGIWTNWTFHYKRSQGSAGIAQVWQNGKKLVDYKGPTTYTNNSNGTWKHGIYLGAAENHEKYVIHFDDVRIALGANQYDAIQPNKTAGECTVSSQKPEPPRNLQIRKVEIN